MQQHPTQLWRHTALGTALIISAVLSLVACGSSAGSNTPSTAATAAIAAPSIATTDSSPSPSAAHAEATASPRPSATPAVRAAAVPAFSHIYLIVMENKEYGSIVGSSEAPYLNWLIRHYALATNYYAITHPSEPNYVSLFSGSTQGIRDDGVHDFSGKNLADELDAHGKTWRVFAENDPRGCYTGATSSDGEDGSGTYARKHEPAISFTDISRDRSRCGRITDLGHFSPATANFELIVPNMCHDMHDCSIRTGDSFLSMFVPRITQSSTFTNSVLFITWDEGSTSMGGGGHVATIAISQHIVAGIRSSIPHNHYSLLHTIERAWALGCIGDTCTANDLGELFRR